MKIQGKERPHFMFLVASVPRLEENDFVRAVKDSENKMINLDSNFKDIHIAKRDLLLLRDS